jgi:hypothetical protein
MRMIINRFHLSALSSVLFTSLLGDLHQSQRRLARTSDRESFVGRLIVFLQAGWVFKDRHYAYCDNSMLVRCAVLCCAVLQGRAEAQLDCFGRVPADHVVMCTRYTSLCTTSGTDT